MKNKPLILGCLTLLIFTSAILESYAYSTPLCPLRQLCAESDVIVIGKVETITPTSYQDKHESPCTLVKFRVSAVLKGNLKQEIIDIYYCPHTCCPEPPYYPEKKIILAFLDARKDGDGYETHALSSGTRILSEQDLKVFVAQIQRFLKIEETKNTVSLYNYMESITEWLVQCAEEPATCWDATFDLCDRSTIKYLNRISIEWFMFLNETQKKRLADTLFNSSELSSGKLNLMELVSTWNDERLPPFILKHVKSAYNYLDTYNKPNTSKSAMDSGLILEFSDRFVCLANNILGTNESKKLANEFLDICFWKEMGYVQRQKEILDNFINWFEEDIKSGKIKYKTKQLSERKEKSMIDKSSLYLVSVISESNKSSIALIMRGLRSGKDPMSIAEVAPYHENDQIGNWTVIKITLQEIILRGDNNDEIKLIPNKSYLKILEKEFGISAFGEQPQQDTEPKEEKKNLEEPKAPEQPSKSEQPVKTEQSSESKPPQKIDNSKESTDKKEQTVESLFKELQEKFKKINDYQCVFDAFVAKDDKTDRRVYNYYFKKDKSIRMEIIEGKNNGAKLVYSGKNVKIRLSGIIISLFTFTFEPTDKKICDLRGFSIPQSDWGTFINEHIKYLEKCSSKIIAKDTVNNKETIIVEIESRKPDETMDIAREKIWLDNTEKILLKFEQYDKKGKLMRANSYKNIKINSGLKDDLFQSP